jgi:perosamine synthetase
MIALDYKQAISDIIKCKSENVFLYWKGRVALYAVLKAMGIKEGDEIILPAFTCVVVPNAILYSGAKPVYVDINLENYNADIDKLSEAINPRTKAIICQNTFGLSSNIEQIVLLAREKNVFTIEDCTHGFGGIYNGKPNGSYCDAAFYSTQWNKPFSTGIGGFLVVNNENLINDVQNLEKEKIKPSLNDQITLRLLIFLNKYFVNRFTNHLFVKLYRVLSNNNLIIGSTQGKEISELKKPDDYFKDMSKVQILTGLKELKRLNKLNQLRKKNAIEYTNFLKLHGKVFVKEKFFKNHLFLKYPILVSDRDVFFQKAIKKNIVLGDWFCSPIYPIKKNLHRWGYNQFKFPVAKNVSKKIVNLPTDLESNSKVLNFLKQNIHMIL